MDATRHIPSEYLFQISEQAPRALATYLLIVHASRNDGYAEIDRAFVEKDKSLSWTRFKNDTKALARLGLLEWTEKKENTIIIQLADINEE